MVFLRERFFPADTDIESFNSIAVIAADGEHVPYGKPELLAERLTDGD
jgi:hypothetical protein